MEKLNIHLIQLHQNLCTEWEENPEQSHKFYNAFAKETDYGTCCFIVPNLDFVNPKTKDMDPEKYDPSTELIARNSLNLSN